MGMAVDRRKAVKVGFYDIEKTIGKGNFAVVKLARHRITKSQVKIGLLNVRSFDDYHCLVFSCPSRKFVVKWTFFDLRYFTD